MDTSLNKESKGQNRAFEETEEMVKAELSKDGKTLDLTACYLKELGAKDIARMEILRDLSTLEMGTNMIGTKGARYIAQSEVLVNLTSLNLFYNAIGNDGAKQIAISDNLLSLSNLTLSDNNITDEGAKYIAKFLPLWTNLRRLDLRLNKIRDEGQMALMEAKEKTGLQQLLLDKFEGFNVKGGGHL